MTSTIPPSIYQAKRSVLYHCERHSLEMGEREFSEVLTYLAVEERVTASSQGQALSALLVLAE